jgi:8-oxo-dGTP diphosphatase
MEIKEKRHDCSIRNDHYISKTYKYTEACVENMRNIRVVAGAIVQKKRLLVAQRSAQMSSPLNWEVPGGKVEGTESDHDALKRELWEELRIRVQIERFLDCSRVVVGDREIEMYVYCCSILEGVPQALEHAQLLWASAEEIASLSWAEADVPLLDQFVGCLKGN